MGLHFHNWIDYTADLSQGCIFNRVTRVGSSTSWILEVRKFRYCRKGFKNGLTIQLTCHKVAFSIELLEWGHPLPGYWRSENSDTVGRDLKMARFLLYQA